MQEIFHTSISNNTLVRDEIMHVLFALVSVFVVWKKTKSRKLALTTVLVAILVDVDHLVDYFSFYGFKFNLANFLEGKYFKVTQKAYVPFHAWEWVILLGIIAKNRGWKSYFTAIALGLFAHLVYDSISQSSFLFYSIGYRALISGYGFLW